jgi:hypothetical protein
MTYKLFIDDERCPTDPSCIVVRTSMTALAYVMAHGIPQHISFDHDLGNDDTSMVFINSMINYMLDNGMKFPHDFAYDVHSQNPVGVGNIKSLMDNAIKMIGKEYYVKR